VAARAITIHGTFLPHDDPDASLAFYRDTLGFEVPQRRAGPETNRPTLIQRFRPYPTVTTERVTIGCHAATGCGDDHLREPEDRLVCERQADGSWRWRG